VRDLRRAEAVFSRRQVWPKRCGHMKGKQVVARRTVEKLKAAIEAKDGKTVFHRRQNRLASRWD
jgi:methylisocitrate lyase